MYVKLTDAELTVMNILWDKGEISASEIAKQAQIEREWEKNTVYTIISRLIKKNAVKRRDPGFICKAMIDRETICKEESKLILNKLYNGSLSLFAKSFLKAEKLSEEELKELRNIIDSQ